jgi:hypothetical protein
VSQEKRIDPGNHFRSAIIWGMCYKYRKAKSSAYEHRDCAENFSVRHGIYPGEKSLPSYANCIDRARMTESFEL